MNRFEIIAAIFGVVSVYLSVRQNIWSWPTAIINVAMYIVVFYRSKLYSDTGLQVVYVVLNFYGWYQWLYGGKNRTELPVARTGARLGAILVVIGLVSTAALGTFVSHNTDAALPYMDALTTSTSLLAQWMMTKKLLENWIVWVSVDVVYIGMYIYKDLYVTSALYAVFLVLSVMGYLEWKRSLAKHELVPVPA